MDQTNKSCPRFHRRRIAPVSVIEHLKDHVAASRSILHEDAMQLPTFVLCQRNIRNKCHVEPLGAGLFAIIGPSTAGLPYFHMVAVSIRALTRRGGNDRIAQGVEAHGGTSTKIDSSIVESCRVYIVNWSAVRQALACSPRMGSGQNTWHEHRVFASATHSPC